MRRRNAKKMAAMAAVKAQIETEKANLPEHGAPRLSFWQTKPEGEWAGVVEVWEYPGFWMGDHATYCTALTREEVIDILRPSADRIAEEVLATKHIEKTTEHLEIHSAAEAGQKRII